MDIKKILLGIGAVALIIASSVGISFLSTSYLLEKQNEESVVDETGEVPDERPVIYVPFEPFVVNFVQGQSLRYLQLTVEFLARDEQLVEEINSRKPEIRNSLILLLSNHNYDELATREGKENVRSEIFTEVNSILNHNEGIESVYLTGFVMQ